MVFPADSNQESPYADMNDIFKRSKETREIVYLGTYTRGKSSDRIQHLNDHHPILTTVRPQNNIIGGKSI